MTVKLTEWTQCGGCAAKWGGVPLTSFLSGMGAEVPPGLTVGLQPFDDAAVYTLGPGLALVSTTDFFPPLVDDPDDYGAIAAANACSDVFAMGGRVILALNLAAMPERLPGELIGAIFEAAAKVVREAGGVVAGGHTIRSVEPIFGLAVQGVVDPDRVWRKSGARPGDKLVLSKPLGTGLVLAGGSSSDRAVAIAGMRQLNSGAAADLHRLTTPPRAVTDVTGYGLAGHSWEMAERSGVSVLLEGQRLPVYPGTIPAASSGVRTGGHERNRSYVGQHFSGGPDLVEAILFDPQTSGGLLASVPPEEADDLCSGGSWHEVGEVLAGPPRVGVE